MTEIPEHLLKRSKSAKSKGGGSDASAAVPPEGSGSAAPAPAAAPATPEKAPLVPTADLPNLDPEPEPPRPEPAYVAAAKARKKIPVWAIPVVAALPIWAWSYAGTLQQPEVEDPLFTEGALFYTEAGCSGCHGAAGGGGTGHQLSAGSVLETFPEPIDQIVHVARGSAAIQGETYGAVRADGSQHTAGSLGQMPAQEGQIPMVELEMIVFHERAVLSGEDTSSDAYQEWMDRMREEFEAGTEDEVDLEFLLACANPEYTPGATGVGSDDPEAHPCPGPAADEGGEQAAAAG